MESEEKTGSGTDLFGLVGFAALVIFLLTSVVGTIYDNELRQSVFAFFAFILEIPSAISFVLTVLLGAMRERNSNLANDHFVCQVTFFFSSLVSFFVLIDILIRGF